MATGGEQRRQLPSLLLLLLPYRGAESRLVSADISLGERTSHERMENRISSPRHRHVATRRVTGLFFFFFFFLSFFLFTLTSSTSDRRREGDGESGDGKTCSRELRERDERPKGGRDSLSLFCLGIVTRNLKVRARGKEGARVGVGLFSWRSGF